MRRPHDRWAHLVLHGVDGLVVGEPQGGTIGVTFTRSITRSGSTDRLPVRASTPPQSTAPTKPATSAMGHTGGARWAGRAGPRGGEAAVPERRDLRGVAPQAVVGGQRRDATDGVVVAVVVRGHGCKR